MGVVLIIAILEISNHENEFDVNSRNIRPSKITRYTVYMYVFSYLSIFTPHAQRERGKVIGRGVHIYICLWSKKKFESYFRDRLTFSNVDSRTSR